jgi:hypothetical protein
MRLPDVRAGSGARIRGGPSRRCFAGVPRSRASPVSFGGTGSIAATGTRPDTGSCPGQLPPQDAPHRNKPVNHSRRPFYGAR